MIQEQEAKLLQRFEKDSGWFHKNIDVLRKEGFEEKFVAIKEGKPVASDKNLDIVIKAVEAKGENPAYIFIEFVHPRGFTLLL